MKKQDWLLTTYGTKDKVLKAVVIEDRLEKEAEKEAFNDVNSPLVLDWTLVSMKDEIKRFAEEWGQSDGEIANNLGFDQNDDGFSELVINHDYIWVKEYKVWIPENSRLYDKRDDVVVEYIKNHR